jgi:hypothetical protein
MTVYIPPVQNQLIPTVGSSEVAFYHEKVAAKLSGHFDTSFWHTLIMQLSQSEPTVRHAVAAINAVHRDIESSKAANPSVFYVPPNPQVLHESTAAMRCLTRRINADPTSHHISLVACLLFTCVEFMCGSVDSAMVHMMNGFRILDESLIKTSENVQFRSTDQLAIEQYIVPVFSRLELVCLLFGHVLPPNMSVVERTSYPLSSLGDARQRLCEVMKPSLRFIRVAGEKTHSTLVVDVDDQIRQLQLQRDLEEWLDELNDFQSKMNSSEQVLNKDALNILRLHHRVTSIWLSVCLILEESVTDSYTAAFEEIIDLATSITSQSKVANSESHQEFFSFEMQIIPPLYYTAIKCRVPSIRRRAIDLLRAAPQQEGLWNAHIVRKVAEKTIEVEERYLASNHGMPSEIARVHGSLAPRDLPISEARRIHGHSELPGIYKDAQFGIPNGSAPYRIEVTFHSKPWGTDGPSHTWKEDISLHDDET